MAPIKFYIDTQNRRLVSGYSDSSIGVPPSIYAGDTDIAFEVHTLVPTTTNDPSVPFNYIDPVGDCVLAVGYIDSPPASGTYTITDPTAAQTTAAISYNASAATVQAAIRAGLTTNYSTAVVTGSNPFQIDRVATGSVAMVTMNTDALLPESLGETFLRRNGTGTLSQLQVIRLTQSPIALATTNTTLTPTNSITAVEQLEGSATTNAMHLITLPSGSYAGTFTLSSTSLGAANTDSGTSLPINFGSDADVVKTQIDTGWGTGNTVDVSKLDNWNYVVTYSGDNIKNKDVNLATGDTSLLSQPKGWSGTISLNTTAAITTLGMEDLLQMAIEVQQVNGSSITTLWQDGSTTVFNDLINQSTTPSGVFTNSAVEQLNSKLNYLLAGY